MEEVREQPAEPGARAAGFGKQTVRVGMACADDEAGRVSEGVRAVEDVAVLCQIHGELLPPSRRAGHPAGPACRAGTDRVRRVFVAALAHAPRPLGRHAASRAGRRRLSPRRIGHGRHHWVAASRMRRRPHRRHGPSAGLPTARRRQAAHVSSAGRLPPPQPGHVRKHQAHEPDPGRSQGIFVQPGQRPCTAPGTEADMDLEPAK